MLVCQGEKTHQTCWGAFLEKNIPQIPNLTQAVSFSLNKLSPTLVGPSPPRWSCFHHHFPDCPGSLNLFDVMHFPLSCFGRDSSFFWVEEDELFHKPLGNPTSFQDILGLSFLFHLEIIKNRNFRWALLKVDKKRTETPDFEATFVACL